MSDYSQPVAKSHRSYLDIYIGERVKSRRSFLGISQEKLGSHLGVTFQQIQKYEKGINRISASMLHGIANFLSVDFSYFVDGYKGESSLREESTPVYEMDNTKKKETTDLLRAYYKITDPVVRKKALELVKAIAATQKVDE